MPTRDSAVNSGCPQSKITLRPYQDDLVRRCRDAFAAGARKIVPVAPPRSGKTCTFAYMAHGASQRGIPVLVLAHRDVLIEQASATFDRFGIDHGLILSGRSGNRLPVQLGMVKTVANRINRIAPPGLIIVDEAHRALGKSYLAILDAFPNARVLLFTATPARTDGRGLGQVADALIMGPQPRELIAAGAICEPRIFVPPLPVDLSDIPDPDTIKGVAAAGARMDTPSITGDVIAHYRQYAAGKPFIAFCSGIKHAASVAVQFNASGISTRNIDGTQSREERREIIAALRTGAIVGVTSADLISEGFDIPSVHCTIHLRRTSSLIIYIQQYFRSLTPEPGKDFGVILDHVGNFDRFGPPHADREWCLDDKRNHNRKPIEKGLTVRRCEKCFAVYESHLAHCPHCGTAPAPGSRVVEERDGELVEVTERDRRTEMLASAKYGEALASCETAMQIREMANARGYRSTWTILRVMERFGVSKWDAAEMCGYQRGAAAHVRDHTA